MSTDYKVKVNFASVHPILPELQEMVELFNSCNFHLFTETDILYFESGSATAFYDFIIDKIDHDKKIVWLIAA